MRISDWSSDVCSSDLLAVGVAIDVATIERRPDRLLGATGPTFEEDGFFPRRHLERRIAIVVGWATDHAIRAAPMAAHIRHDLMHARFDVHLHRASSVNGFPRLAFIQISRCRAIGRDKRINNAWTDEEHG